MIPIAKNIIVVDEQGNEYESTYPKRARGLVKHGRARFIEENKICLACRPNNILEDEKMLDNIDIEHQNTDLNDNNNDFQDTFNNTINRSPNANGKLSMDYVLDKIEKIALQTEYLNQVIQNLGEMSDGFNAEPMSPDNNLGPAKAQALGDVVRCRETTNQQLLKFYEKMYDDLKPQSQANTLKDILNYVSELPPLNAQESLMKLYNDVRPKSNIVTKLDDITNWMKSLNKDEFSQESWLTIQEAVKSQLSRN